MIHINPAENHIYIYSGIDGLTNFSLKLSRQKARDTIEIIVPLTVVFFGNSFYKLLMSPAPTLDSVEYVYEVTADGVIIDKGILRYGAI